MSQKTLCFYEDKSLSYFIQPKISFDANVVLFNTYQHILSASFRITTEEVCRPLCGRGVKVHCTFLATVQCRAALSACLLLSTQPAA